MRVVSVLLLLGAAGLLGLAARLGWFADGQDAVATFPRSAGRSRLEGRVLAAGAGVPARVELVRVGDLAEDAPTPLDEGWTLPAPAAAQAVASAEAAADGAFAFAGLAPGRYEVAARLEDGRRGTEATTIEADRQRLVVEVGVGTAQETLAGRVHTADGRPWRGALVLRRSWGGAPRVLALDSDGRFHAEGVEPGRCTLVAVEPGLRRIQRVVSVPNKVEVEVEVDGEPDVRLRVLGEGGAPRAGVEVAVRGGDVTTWREERVLTGVDGGVALFRGAQYATVRAAGFAARVVSVVPGMGVVDVRLVRGAVIEGRVVRAEDGRGAAGARVAVFALNSPFGALAETHADDEGLYRIEGLAAGDVLVAAGSEETTAAGLEHADLDGGAGSAVRLRPGETFARDLLVVPAAVLEGVVRDPDGRPVPGALVGATPCTASLSSDDFAFPRPACVVWPRRVASGSDGWFRIAVGFNEPCSLTASAPGLAGATVGPYRTAPGSRTSVEIALRSARTVRFFVAPPAGGRPIAGATVRAHVSAAESALPSFVTGWQRTTDERGEVRLNDVPVDGRLLAEVRAPGFVRWDRELDIPPTGMLDVALDQGRTLRGRVTFEDGEPAPNATVGVSWQDGPARPLEIWTAVDGTFETDEVGQGLVSVEAWGSRNRGGARRPDDPLLGDWYRSETQRVLESAAEAHVMLLRRPPATRGVSLTVLDATGRPVPRARTSQNGDARLVVDGRATLDAVRGRSDRIHVWAPTDESGVPLPFGCALADLAPGATALEIRLPPARRLAGRVRDPAGRGVPAILVLAAPRSWHKDAARRLDTAAAVAWTDADGAFALDGLGEEPVRVRAYPPPVFARPRPLDEAPGADLDVVLRPGTTAVISVLDDRGRPVALARVVSGGNGATTDVTGRALLRGLDPDAREVLFVHPPSRGRWNSARLADWRPGDATLVLPAK